ncbi:FecR family protein [Variovorax sp. ZT5P49]|uniref:FecR family protein n=1 Tax=Variovorax sp. ZT5P49 TaxID=3443733 RepID=UPI003F44F654
MTKPDDRNNLPDVHKDAQAWVRKLTSGHVSAWEAQAFKRWRDADTSHLAAFQEATHQWQLLESVSGGVLDTNAEAARYHHKTLHQPRVGRRAFLGVAVGGAAAAGIAAYSPLGLWPAADQWEADYRTAVGEQRELALGDRVTVSMNTRTSLRRVSDHDQPVGVELLEGEAAVEVRADAQPFRVLAGAGRVIADVAGFEVRYLDERICVTCLHGKVSIEHPAGRRQLQARQLAVYDSRAISEIGAVDPDNLSPWRQGELVFKQTPLPAVLAEINRYRPGRVMLMGDAMRAKTVTARIKIAEIDTALLQIQYTFDLSVRSFPAGVLVLS